MELNQIFSQRDGYIKKVALWQDLESVRIVIGEKWFNLKVHQYKDGKIWIESNDIIDNVIDIEVVEHDYRKIE